MNERLYKFCNNFCPLVLLQNETCFRLSLFIILLLLKIIISTQTSVSSVICVILHDRECSVEIFRW